MTYFQRLGLAWLTFAVIAFFPMRAEADFLQYTETITATGTLGSTPFSNALVTLTMTADPSTVIAANPYQTPPGVATVTVNGVGTATFADQVYVYNNQSFLGTGYAGFADNALGITIVATASDVFTTYDLQSPLSPTSGASFAYTDGTFYPTSLGNLTFTSVAATSTFAVSSVPEPSSLVLCGMAGLAGLGLARARRKVR